MLQYQTNPPFFLNLDYTHNYCVPVCMSHHPVASDFQGGGGHHGPALQDADLWRPTAWLRWKEEHVHSTSTANRERQGGYLKHLSLVS